MIKALQAIKEGRFEIAEGIKPMQVSSDEFVLNPLQGQGYPLSIEP